MFNALRIGRTYRLSSRNGLYAQALSAPSRGLFGDSRGYQRKEQRGEQRGERRGEQRGERRGEQRGERRGEQRGRFDSRESSRDGGSLFSSGGFRPKREMSDRQSLEPIDWSSVNLVPFEKDFYVENPEVAAQTEEEVKEVREQYSLQVFGRDIPKPIRRFDQLKLPDIVHARLKESGFTTPTGIQSQGWPMALSGKDMVGVAQTGSGKTISYLLPALIHIDAQKPIKRGDGPIGLVLCPTRELAQQIYEECNKVTAGTGFKVLAVYGGVPNKALQAKKLSEGVHLLIACPGRLIDLIESGYTDLNRVTYLVLDEADRCLDMGFEDSIRTICSQIRPDRQTTLWSATWPKSVEEIASSVTSNACQIVVGSTELTANPDIEQKIVVMPDNRNKFEYLLKVIKETDGKTLVFSASKNQVDVLEELLYEERIKAIGIHGGKTQASRSRALQSFKDGNHQVLIATDVASRGLDVKNVNAVVNYDFPNCIESYIHRIGRTGRAGNKGKAVSFFTHSDNEFAGLRSELVRVLKESGQEVPDELNAMGSRSRGRSTGNGNRGGRNQGYGGGNFNGRSSKQSQRW